MGAHRELAVAAMALQTRAPNDFMTAAQIDMPLVLSVSGALPAMARHVVPAKEVHELVDLCMQFTIGDYEPGLECSSYYNPDSPWYNVFFGAYGLRSYKPDGSAWGYDRGGQRNFYELLDLVQIDYNFFTAAMLGCPADQLCFTVKTVNPVAVSNNWDAADVAATIPSALHDPQATLGDPSTYLFYGVPDQKLVASRPPYHPVDMRGRLHMKRMPTKGPEKHPITLAWGGLCPDTAPGQVLLDTILNEMGTKYLRL